MPVVRMPDNRLVKFPDDMPPEQIKRFIASKFPDAASKEDNNFDPEAFKAGAQQGATFSFGDELKAIGEAAKESIFKKRGEGKDFGQVYEQEAGKQRLAVKEAQERSPASFLAGEVAGGMVVPGGITAKVATKGAKTLPYLAKALTGSAAKRGATAGAAAGALTGAGEAENISDIPASSSVGLVAGGTGGAVTGTLLNKIGTALFKKPAADIKYQDFKNLDDYIGGGVREFDDYNFEARTEALKLIKEKLQQDFGENYPKVVDAWQKNDLSLAELYSPKVTNLAKGAAQYSKGEPIIESFFEQKVADMPERVIGSIKKNVNDFDNYYLTTKDLLSEGQQRAAPLYKEAFADKKAINDKRLLSFLESDDVRKGIAEGAKIKQNEAMARGETFNLKDDAFTKENVPMFEMFDTAVRGLDNIIPTQINPNTRRYTQYGLSLVQLRKAIKNRMYEINPKYKQAVDTSGDYLSVEEAQRAGLNFDKPSVGYEKMIEDFKSLTPKEKEGFRLGVSKQLINKIETSAGNRRDPYNTILKDMATQKKLAAVLSPAQYKNLRSDLEAERALFKAKQRILGGSPTASKQLAAAEIAEGSDLAAVANDLINLQRSPLQTFINKGAKWLGRVYAGLGNNTAEEVARILYESNPQNKLKLVNALKNKKHIENEQKRMALKAFAELDGLLRLRKLETAGAVGAGITTSEAVD